MRPGIYAASMFTCRLGMQEMLPHFRPVQDALVRQFRELDVTRYDNDLAKALMKAGEEWKHSQQSALPLLCLYADAGVPQYDMHDGKIGFPLWMAQGLKPQQIELARHGVDFSPLMHMSAGHMLRAAQGCVPDNIDRVMWQLVASSLKEAQEDTRQLIDSWFAGNRLPDISLLAANGKPTPELRQVMGFGLIEELFAPDRWKADEKKLLKSVIAVLDVLPPWQHSLMEKRFDITAMARRSFSTPDEVAIAPLLRRRQSRLPDPPKP